jgi:hypothetical protein
MEHAKLVAQVKWLPMEKMRVSTVLAERSVVMQLVRDLVDVSMPKEFAKNI